jgi:hypothetical protein
MTSTLIPPLGQRPRESVPSQRCWDQHGDHVFRAACKLRGYATVCYDSVVCEAITPQSNRYTREAERLSVLYTIY